MSTLAQAAEGGLDLAKILGVGGPVATIAFVAGFVLREWRQGRKEKREDKTTERTTESGIVETTNQALKIVRGQMAQFQEDLAAEVAKRERMEQDYERQLAALRKRISVLESENDELRTRR